MDEVKSIDILSFTDTGQWRLIVSLAQGEMSAILKNMVDTSIPASVFFKKNFDASSNLLQEIESVIYDNPRILEDFATHIIITTPRSLWIPVEFTDDDEFDENLFTCAYPCRAEDIFSDLGDQEVCLYTMAPGLNSFLKRTLPGCKITSHLSVLKGAFEKLEFEKMRSEGKNLSFKSIYVSIQDKLADIFAFENGKFICGASHQWFAPSDIAYKASLVAKAYGFSPDVTDLQIVGNPSVSQEVKDLIGEYFCNVGVSDLPSASYILGVPATSALATGENLNFSR